MRSARDKTDWQIWHEAYDDPASYQSRRLEVVRGMIRDALDALPSGPLRAISMAAGEGRDLLAVLADHARRRDVTARLVELDTHNADVARATAADAGLVDVDVVTGDASISTVYEGAIPAHLVLACGIFGNVPDDDVEQTIRFLPALCAPGASVIWTRHRSAPDLTVEIRRWFTDAGFDEVEFVGPDDVLFGVGHHRLTSQPRPFQRGVRMFTFFR
jgi:hypothetical protein